MSKTKKGWLPRAEILIVGVFFLSFIIWAASKCSATKALYQEQDELAAVDTIETEEAPAITSTPAAPAATNSTPATTSPATGTPAATSGSTPATTSASGNLASAEEGTPLYVTIDGLNMRATPELNGTIILKLPLNEKVWFMNEVTDTTQQINLGKIVADEPWVKVKHSKGKTGWVYGAGVHYYKMKHPGIID